MTEPDATRQNGKYPELTVAQLNAVDLLVTGKRDTDVAEAVGVTRQTVCGWRQLPRFRAELNRRRREVWSAATERLRGLLPKALDRIEAELDQEHGWRVALRLLDVVGVGKAGLGAIGPDNPAEIEADDREAAYQFAATHLFAGG